MAEFYIGQVMMTGFGFAQKYFAQCNGQLLPITQNAALYALLGNYYGGNGSTNFALPDMRSRTPVGGGFPSLDPNWTGAGYRLGENGGMENVTLLSSQLPMHNHLAMVTLDAGSGVPGPRKAGLTLSASSVAETTPYGQPTSAVPLGGAPLTPSGSNQPHPNIQPFETINFNIALTGIFPSRN